LSEKVVISRIFHYDTMEFPPSWRVFMDEEFETAQPQIEGLTIMELMVQVRHTGRMLSNFRIGLGGKRD
jgi:hypothetical protein